MNDKPKPDPAWADMVLHMIKKYDHIWEEYGLKLAPAAYHEFQLHEPEVGDPGTLFHEAHVNAPF